MNKNCVLTHCVRCYTLALLSRLNSSSGAPVVESEIVEWTNSRLESSGAPTTINNFQDKKIKTSLPVLHLIEALQPGTVDWSNVATGDKLSYGECMDNAKYAVTMARKIGKADFFYFFF